jgi:polysaccharide deacetylase family protein (PEP-CTERM system associated)
MSPPGPPHVPVQRVIHHHFTVDVEEYFQVSAMEPHVARLEWDTLPSRVLDSTVRILDLLEAHDTRGTFFILGWIARRHPDLVRRIAGAGHEVASHGWDHQRVTQLDPDAFRTQAKDSRAILEDLSGKRVHGYRAPSFSIVPGLEWALEILVEEGYTYDSSLYPVRRRGYGFPGGGRHVHGLPLEAGPLTEVPPLTLRAGGFTLPAGGGGTFRQFPLAYTVRALHAMEGEGHGGTFYIHPWEVDPDQPRVNGVPLLTRIRHYRGLAQTETRLAAILSRFRFRPIADTLAAGN